MAELLQAEEIEQVILLIRGQRVMLDRDLAALYGVQTKNLNKAVQRKIEGHDASIRSLFDAIRKLAAPPAQPRREIGFHIKEDSVRCRVRRKVTILAVSAASSCGWTRASRRWDGARFPSPTGRKTIAQRFNAGVVGREENLPHDLYRP